MGIYNEYSQYNLNNDKRIHLHNPKSWSDKITWQRSTQALPSSTVESSLVTLTARCSNLCWALTVLWWMLVASLKSSEKILSACFAKLLSCRMTLLRLLTANASSSFCEPFGISPRFACIGWTNLFMTGIFGPFNINTTDNVLVLK